MLAVARASVWKKCVPRESTLSCAAHTQTHTSARARSRMVVLIGEQQVKGFKSRRGCKASTVLTRPLCLALASCLIMALLRLPRDSHQQRPSRPKHMIYRRHFTHTALQEPMRNNPWTSFSVCPLVNPALPRTSRSCDINSSLCVTGLCYECRARHAMGLSTRARARGHIHSYETQSQQQQRAPKCTSNCSKP